MKKVVRVAPKTPWGIALEKLRELAEQRDQVELTQYRLCKEAHMEGNMLPSKTFDQAPSVPYMSKMWQRKPCVASVLFVSICSVVALGGCASNRSADPARLTQNPVELQALQAMQAENPALMKDPEMMEIALQSFRAGQSRRQAIAIELRHQYPTLTPAELLTLIDDRMARESDAMLNTAMPAPVDCQSMRLGAFVNTSCY